jgi:DNA-binding XRE family transcriptional regulator
MHPNITLLSNHCNTKRGTIADIYKVILYEGARMGVEREGRGFDSKREDTVEAMSARRGGRGKGIPMPELRRHRLLQGYTVRELADEAGVTHSTIVELEQGHRGAQGSTLRKLAKALGVETKDLVGNALD